MKARILLLFICVATAFASCTTDNEPGPQFAKSKLIEKKWYQTGKDGKVWVLYKQDGNWESSSGDYGTWNLVNGNELTIKATKDVLKNWEEDILELTDSYLKKKVIGVPIALEYETAP